MSAKTKSSFLVSFLLWFLGILILLVIIIPLAVLIFFSPNEFKPQISAHIQRAAGVNIEIHGNIAMHFFPYIALNVSDIVAKQPEGFDGELLNIKNLELKISIIDLFRKKVHIDSFKIDGLNLKLIRTKSGMVNWQTQTKSIQNTESNQPGFVNKTKSLPIETENTSQKNLTFDFNKFKISNSQISFIDQKSDQITRIDKVVLDITKSSAPSKYTFKMEYKLNSAKPDLNIDNDGVLKGTADLENSILEFSTQSNYDLHQDQTPLSAGKLHAEGKITQESLSLNNLILLSKDLRIEGNAQFPIKDNRKPITFDLKGNQLDLNAFAKQPHSSSNPTNAPISSATSSAPHVTTQPSTTAKLIKGKVHFDKVKLKQHQLENVNADIQIQNNLIKIDPLTAQIYKGALNIKAIYNLATKNSSVQGILQQIDVVPFLNSLNAKIRIQGLANVDFDLLYNNTVTGTSHIQVKDGILNGVDIRYYISVAEALLKKTQTTESDTKQTAFGQLSATLKIHDNIIDTNDLLLLAQDLKASGEGSVNLSPQTVEFKILAYRLKDGVVRENDYPLALRIKGPLAHPKITPDLDVYLKELLKKEAKEKLSKQVEKNLKKIITNSSGEETTPDVQNKVEKEIEKGLKKLFKKKKDD